ncbi:mechanosensitive ion channel family protein [Haloarchaeobius sp. TZWWS8]|uniref:mechanosensitive ion channel family protein n=1 Tax=Haloarchaeobius sp. TZWWS8 TaxID=3446121 RepID=UPI003EB7EC05
MLTQTEVPTDWNEIMSQYGEIVGAVAAFIAAFVVVYLVGRIVAVPLIKKGILERGLDETIASVAEDVTHAVLFFAAVAIAFTVAGFGSFLAAFATLGGAMALALGFAAQDLLGNFVAGLFILKDKPFKVGDWIEWNDKQGIVEDIDLRVSRVRTFDNERITVPNSELADNAVTNPVAYDKLRQKFVFGIGYEDDIEHAKDVILDEAAKNDDIMDDPGTSIRVTELADSYVGLQTRFWIANPSRADFMKVRSDLVEAVKNRLDAEAIEMPYPYRELEGGISIENAAELMDVQRGQSQAASGD